MKTALVTGASSGLGRATSIEMARRGFHVIAAGRSRERTMTVVEEIENGVGTAEYLPLDLASLSSSREAAEIFGATNRPLDVLINNAGVGGVRGVTEDGFEIHFGVNHLGHFMLTHHLRHTFRPRTRIVVVTSEAYRRADGIDFNRVRKTTRSLTGFPEYSVSKLANILFVRRLARLQPDWQTYAVHPGLVDTNIYPAIAKPFFRKRRSPEEGAQTTVWCATSEDLAETSGDYFADRKVKDLTPMAKDDGLAKKLWTISEEWCGVAPRHG